MNYRPRIPLEKKKKNKVLQMNNFFFSFVAKTFPRQKVRRPRSGRVELGRHLVHAGQRQLAVRWPKSQRAERACIAWQVPHTLLHVDGLRKSAQEIPRPQSDQASLTRSHHERQMDEYRLRRGRTKALQRAHA